MKNIRISAVISTILLATLGLPISGCAATVGQQFRDIMADIDAQCRKDKMGPYLDEKDPQYINKKYVTDCDILKLKPADPLATEEGRFAYSIKLPPPHDKPKVKYQPGMSAGAYFKELCEKDAGEWIFKTVEGVEGVFQGRQNIRKSESGDSLLVFQMREATEIISRNLEDSLVQPINGRYNYLERPLDTDETGKPYVRFYRSAEVPEHYMNANRKKRLIHVPAYIVNKEQANTLKSRYGFTWRQIANKDAMENGIVGGETIIFDRTTSEVLAFRRFFYRYWPRPDSRYTRLTNDEFCRPRFADGGPEFIQKVLVPINPAE